jgi:hypothetical protein
MECTERRRQPRNHGDCHRDNIGRSDVHLLGQTRGPTTPLSQSPLTAHTLRSPHILHPPLPLFLILTLLIIVYIPAVHWLLLDWRRRLPTHAPSPRNGRRSHIPALPWPLLRPHVDARASHLSRHHHPLWHGPEHLRRARTAGCLSGFRVDALDGVFWRGSQACV